MSYFRICQFCGATLDPGERCECIRQEQKSPVKKTTKDRKPLHQVKKLVAAR